MIDQSFGSTQQSAPEPVTEASPTNGAALIPLAAPQKSGFIAAVTRLFRPTPWWLTAETARGNPCAIVQRADIVARLDQVLRHSARNGAASCAFMITLDDAPLFAERLGRAGMLRIIKTLGQRLSEVHRDTDFIAQITDGVFVLVLAPVRRSDTDTMLYMARRLQAAIEAPIALDGGSVLVSCSIGLCPTGPGVTASADEVLTAIEQAQSEATLHGPGAIRFYAASGRGTTSPRQLKRSELTSALEKGEVLPFFQPQICTQTGNVVGFEALARWQHPDHGLLGPSAFLPDLHKCGLSSRLSEVMVQTALAALRAWDEAGFYVPSIAVNFSSDELRDAGLVDRLRWELDRHDMEPDRLTIEILETVAADTNDDIIVRNITALAALGCGIDLDDFGTGHASIANIRRFSVRRLKIDRSFVMRLDEDPEQRKMVSAILSLAERLGLESVAEGVESMGEHSVLSELGCRYVQGYGIGKPMSHSDALIWLTRHEAKRSAQLAPARQQGA